MRGAGERFPVGRFSGSGLGLPEVQGDPQLEAPRVLAPPCPRLLPPSQGLRGPAPCPSSPPPTWETRLTSPSPPLAWSPPLPAALRLTPPRPQVVSLGLYFGEQAYLRSSWNVLDGFLVFVSIIDIVVSLASAGGAKILGVLRVLRLLRTLRPLR